jgi:uncharacterized cupredoxin-like copper-binding protein
VTRNAEGAQLLVEDDASVLQSGDSTTLTADLSKPGRYEWYCR